MMCCTLVLAMLFAFASAQSSDPPVGDIDELVAQVFGTGNNGQTDNQQGVFQPITPDPSTATNGNVAPNSVGTNQLSSGTGTSSINLNPGSGVNLNPSNNVDKSCTNTDGQAGECVQYYLCDGNNTIITDGVGLIDIRLRDGPCESYMELCCLPPDVVKTPITPPPVAEVRSGCGYRNPDGVGFRIKGDKDNEAQFGEFPWMVAILREETVDGTNQKLNVYQCGGALIHPSVVLTAAHCVAGKVQQGMKLKVRAGEWDTQTKLELLPHQDKDVEKVTVHEQYYAGALFNDIALLFLREPVNSANNIGIACLPTSRQVVSAPTRCYASGWGKDVFGKEGKYQVILKKVDLPVVDRQQCVDALRKTRLGSHFELHNSFMCAGGEPGKDTCRGDGGSPLVCPIQGENERYIQSGIVAWGIGCGEGNTPGVYADVSMFRDWIDEQMIYNRFDSASYTY